MKFDLELYKQICERRSRKDIKITCGKIVKPISRDDIIGERLIDVKVIK